MDQAGEPAEHPLAAFQAACERELAAAVAALRPGVTPHFAYGTPPPGQGELAAACFPLAGPLKEDPARIAARVAETVTAALEATPGPHWIARVRAAGPYVNFAVDRARLTTTVVRTAHADPDSVGRLPPRNERVVLEHTSANPTGPLHVGRARNPIVGDTLVRIYRAAGYETSAQYYMDDMGKQVAILTWGVERVSDAEATELAGPAARAKPDHVLVRHYQAANRRMEADEEVRAEIQEIVRQSEAGDPATIERVHAGYARVFAGMLESLARLNVAYDEIVEESRFVLNGDTARVIERLATQQEVPVERDGEALALDLAGHGVSGKSTLFWFRRGDGTSLYATRDVAYHAWKAQQADRLVDVLGEDHKLQAKQVRACLETLQVAPLPEVVFYSFVSLPAGRMSTREGRVVYVDDLLDEAVARARAEVDARRGTDLDEKERTRIAEAVGVGAVRFAIAKIQCEKQIKFEWEEALALEGFAAPFIQYSHARMAGIIRRGNEAGYAPEPESAALLVHPSETELAHTVARLAPVIEEAAAKNRPHLVPQYAYDLAVAFNAFYRDCRVVQAETAELAAARLALVAAARLALAAALGLLGIEALEEM